MSTSEVDNLNNQLFGGKKAYNLIDVYHYLMVSYGYISFEEFKKMDAGLVDELVARINEMNKKDSSAGRRGKY